MDWFYTVLTDRIESNAKIVFIGSCNVAEPFAELWGFDNEPAGRAFIAPDSPTVETNLYKAAGAWVEMAKVLARRGTVGEAVDAGNGWLEVFEITELKGGNWEPLRFKVYPAGATNVRIE